MWEATAVGARRDGLRIRSAAALALNDSVSGTIDATDMSAKYASARDYR
ncbi:hypothetical protein [Burkholderia sp. ABCPW 14]|nr:hypothetical protein [Burkholderia sp. ABCPW 14]